MIIADTGYWLALANPKDRYHHLAIDVSHQITVPLVVTWPVLTETCHLLMSRLGVSAQIKFMAQLQQVAKLFQLESKHLNFMQILMEKYRQLPMDLADASLVIVAETLGHGEILSTDRRDFETYRWKNHKPFNNLLLSST
ncbi:VapC toxin family PIN domain ribonuclease [Exilibacterium tricleocarpae]|uniref:VapC toxin family PIN domain ribonuclease n=1 Tax=Exilibacterium tricleocarpae TaxID=2591008 RepID=A0A545U4C4_9GAMM|nr:VapC toxin family PIN domain ribonuclease [Exilibacterium tricleocarpae]TQV84294.1 VapC toxin family PIN domain ribonuclease [Exilibacterium tricleocarpae]